MQTSHPSLWRRIFAFSGPAYLISVGYMDPGNWATDLEGGARFGYQLLWVIVLSSLMAILLQTLSARLGIASQRDLAQACRETYPRPVSGVLWFLCEIAIAACDLAEVLGAAIALNLLFHIPVLAGVLITAVDTLLVLWFSRLGIRMIESFILSLITIIAGCFLFEILWAVPDLAKIPAGLIPRVDGKSLYIAIGILGATVMPHNLYLHSALVQTRRIGPSEREKRLACKYNFIDSTIALNGAMLVNIAILVLSASIFFRRGIVVTEIQQAHQLLSPLMGTAAASVVFGIALLCSGQSSTMTGTMAGQVVMEGFLQFRMTPWLRRTLTRSAAIIPAALTVWIVGDRGTYQLILLSQVILSLQLPFAVIPLVQFTSDRRRMGSLANPGWVKFLAWATAAMILGLNVWLVMLNVRDWLSGWLAWILYPILAGLVTLLFWIALEPVLRRARLKPIEPLPGALPAVVAALPTPAYRKIMVPLDHSALDRPAIAHAAALARPQGAKLYLLHVEEGVTSQMYGALSDTAEIEQGRAYFTNIEESLRGQGIEVEMVVRHSREPKREIVRYARELDPDLIVMGAHGHKGLKDVVFGTTINAVRHSLKTPVLVVRDTV